MKASKAGRKHAYGVVMPKPQAYLRTDLQLNSSQPIGHNGKIKISTESHLSQDRNIEPSEKSSKWSLLRQLISLPK